MMSNAPPLTRDLAMRIERNVANGSLSDSSQIRQFGETLAGKVVGGRPRNRIFCFGDSDISRLGDILAFYAIDNLKPRFSLSPMRFTTELAAVLLDVGFCHYSFEQAILYGLPSKAPASLMPGMTIERVTSNNLNEYVHTVADAFEWPAEWRGAAMDGLRDTFNPDAWSFLARFMDEPAGAASLDCDQNGIASLRQGAVIPKFRNRRCHLALVQHRLFVAHELGCSLVIGGAAFISSSFQNQQRAGMRLAYVETEWGPMKFGKSS
jgi:hypothetical protein